MTSSAQKEQKHKEKKERFFIAKGKEVVTIRGQLKAGDQVYHRKFGEGTVISVEVEADDELVQVAFPDQGIKKLSASVAPLEKR